MVIEKDKESEDAAKIWPGLGQKLVPGEQRTDEGDAMVAGRVFAKN